MFLLCVICNHQLRNNIMWTNLNSFVYIIRQIHLSFVLENVKDRLENSYECNKLCKIIAPIAHLLIGIQCLE